MCSFGVVASATSNAIWTPSTIGNSSGNSSQRDTSAGIAFVPANEDVLSWDIKKGELLKRWHDKDNRSLVTCIARSDVDPDVFAVGYADGSVRLWDAQTGDVVVKFDGHRSAVTCLAFDRSGAKLASGSRDTDLIVWDLIKESGLVRLRGHKEQITGLYFLQPTSNGFNQQDGGVEQAATDGEIPDGFILSTSKDALIKIWDVASQYCIETHVTQSNGECWALGMSSDGSGCMTAGNDGEVKVWSIDIDGLLRHGAELDTKPDTSFLIDKGTLYRQSKERVTSIRFHPKSNHFAIHGSEKAVELWKIKTPSEIKKSLARKRRRAREKAATAEEKDVDGDIQMKDTQDDPANAPVSEVFVSELTVRTGGKVQSVNWAGGRTSKALQLMAATTNNQVEMYSIPVQASSKKSESSEPSDYERTLAVELPGHRTDVRTVALSSDDRMVATASSGALKIWNVKTQSCLRTLDCGYALCSSFLPGDRIVLLGTKTGDLELFDITTSTLLSTIPAHKGAIWSLKVHPDGKSVATGGADKSVKFWRFDITKEEIPGTKRTTPKLKLTHTRTLNLNDDILALCFTPDSKYLAVSTLDTTVKVFFTDSLKLYLNLYGHKLPVLHIAIANDSKLLATCSADKNIRLWGLDFGDCHRAIFAHDDSIMAISFIAEPPNPQDAHTLFSVSKDGYVKTWDADKFQHIQRLGGHHGEIWALAVSRNGETVVTAAHDKSIRVWTQSDEPLFLEEEREKELEDLHDANLAEKMERDALDADAAADEAAGEDGAAVGAPSKQTSGTLTAGEKIGEALTLCYEDLKATEEYESQRASGVPAVPPQRHPLLSFSNTPPEVHLLSVLAGIPSASLQDALLLLPFSTLLPLFTFLAIFLKRQMNVPLTCRVLFFLLRTHHKQVVASAEMRPLLLEMQGRLRSCLGEWKEVLGWNLAACKILGNRLSQARVKRLEDVDEAGGEKGRKRAFVSVA